MGRRTLLGVNRQFPLLSPSTPLLLQWHERHGRSLMSRQLIIGNFRNYGATPDLNQDAVVEVLQVDCEDAKI